MARKPKARPASLSNEGEAADRIRELTTEIQQLEKDRSAVNDKIGSARSQIKAFNVDMVAWAAAKRRSEMDPDVRQEFDRSAVLCSAALGVPMQRDLFKGESDGESDGDENADQNGDAGGIPGTLN